MRPQQQRRMLNSILLTSLSVNSYNPIIDQFFIPLAHRPSAHYIRRSKFCFLRKFDILIPDEIVRLAERRFTLYQDHSEQPFSNELLQFVDYQNEFLDYAEDTLDIWHFIYKVTIDMRIRVFISKCWNSTTDEPNYHGHQTFIFKIEIHRSHRCLCSMVRNMPGL